MCKSRLSWAKQCCLSELFVAGSTARTAATLTDINRSSARYYFHRLREIIMANSKQCDMLDGLQRTHTAAYRFCIARQYCFPKLRFR